MQPHGIGRGGRILVALAVAFAAGRAGEARAQGASANGAPRADLRVCADPNNLPYTNEHLDGFENRIAELIAAELHATVHYTWWPQRRGFIRNTLRENLCDVVVGVPSTYDMVLTTKPYYRSTYVFVYRKDRGYQVRSLDDPILHKLTIGVHLIGDDYANSPPAHALAQRGIVGNVRGYTVYGNYAEPNPPARLVDAVASGEVDVGIIWGPIAGYFARKEPVALELVPVSPAIDLPFLPFVYDVSLGVRRGEDTLKVKLEDVLDRRQADIRRILEEYGVPLVDVPRQSAPTPR
ncbi:MAG TPA: substrate-binding domain-containing protein [Longimicrobiales bacterium]|nr:substrate-binding domain-containing protein [Longimicrobiales bacterium]